MLKPLVTFALFVAAFAVKPSGLTNKLRGGRGECPPEARDLIAECEVNAARPSFGADGCPSCRRPSAWRTCTRMAKKACPAPATCADDQEPELADCCISCKPAKPVCTEETKTACKAAMETLPVWSDNFCFSFSAECRPFTLFCFGLLCLLCLWSSYFVLVFVRQRIGFDEEILQPDHMLPDVQEKVSCQQKDGVQKR